jgi:hypothetical protein
MPGPFAELDESDSDDGAIFAFWRFIARRHQQGRDYDLEDLGSFRVAVAEFEAGA